MTGSDYGDVDEVAQTAAGLVDGVRHLHPTALLNQLSDLIRNAPIFTGQVLMCLAAWVDPDEPADERTARLREIARQKENQ